MQFAYPTIGGATGIVLGFIVVFALIYAWNLLRAPYKQRNEARAVVQARPKPIPLQNRRELIEAIALVEKTTIELINRQDAIDKIYAQWNDSLNSLRREYLVAGEVYEKIAVDFTGFVGMQVMAKMKQVRFSDDVQPVVLKNTLQFVGVLVSRVKETIQKIDELSGQVPDKEDSQT